MHKSEALRNDRLMKILDVLLCTLDNRYNSTSAVVVALYRLFNYKFDASNGFIIFVIRLQHYIHLFFVFLRRSDDM